jgi:hypothetical protein
MTVADGIVKATRVVDATLSIAQAVQDPTPGNMPRLYLKLRW